ncbi:hypothetical protein JTE90_010772 [Oedothorax gibbosus]|uniref:Uncharacterized protein n=1 Tax=Oedothorax gibbosus TaxID=931172 RepID=A0AAV6TYJ9_9ARAC|nr:hypothetical protein JTE90_010772 [Oedothorax gibbosus]
MEPASRTDVDPNRSNKLDKAEKRLFEVMMSKVFNLRIVSGTMEGQNKWAKVLINWGKEKQFMQQCNTGSLDFDENYGKILECGFGDNIPSYPEVVNKLYEDIKENICLVKLKTHD